MTKWMTGTVKTSWNDVSFKTLAYFKEPFNDSSTKQAWDDTYGPIAETGHMVDFRSHQPDYAQDVADELGLEKAGTSFYRMEPGSILPYHSDTYARYCEYHIVEPTSVWRAVIFLEDWKPGHIFEIDGNLFDKWNKGDYVIWNYDVPHLAANLGPDNRCTLQITRIFPIGPEHLQ